VLAGLNIGYFKMHARDAGLALIDHAAAHSGGVGSLSQTNRGCEEAGYKTHGKQSG